jgi:endonuclease YncB( thermonuclease family)
MGIDTPESRTSDKVEKVFGLAAKERLKELLGKDAILITTENKHGEDMKGKFGRVLGDFKVNDKRVTEILIEEGHAVKYFGQNKADIESGHISNRHKLMHEGVIDPADVQKAEEEMK